MLFLHNKVELTNNLPCYRFGCWMRKIKSVTDQNTLIGIKPTTVLMAYRSEWVYFVPDSTHYHSMVVSEDQQSLLVWSDNTKPKWLLTMNLLEFIEFLPIVSPFFNMLFLVARPSTTFQTLSLGQRRKLSTTYIWPITSSFITNPCV
jgi:hypothetical protein